MHKKIQKLRAKIKELTAQAEALAQEEFDTTEAMEQNTQKIEDINKQVEAINGQIEALTKAAKVSQAAARADDDAASAGEVEDGEESDTDDEPGEGVAEDAVQNRKTRSWAKAVKQFAAAARRGFRAEATPDYNRSSSDPDGGYTVPEDIVTRVEELKQTKRSLRDLVRVTPVTKPSGRRTFQTRSDQDGFTEVGEGGKTPKMAGPKFSVINYIIKKLAGWLPIPNELKDDSDANIVEIITRWLADACRVTDNKQILAAIKKKTAVALNGLDGIKHAVLVDLDGAFRSTAKIITNANGLFWLSTLKDANGRELLTPIPSDPAKVQLACGAVVIPVVDYSNKDLPDHADGKIPFIIGDLEEGIELFDRRQLSIAASDVAVAGDFNAFEQDMTLYRGIERIDVQQRDSEAYIYGYIDTNASDSDAPAALGELTVTSVAGTASGATKLTVSPAKGTTSVYKYKVAAAATAVTAGQNVSSWSVWDGTSDITAETGKVITVVEASADYKALKVGTATVTAKA